MLFTDFLYSERSNTELCSSVFEQFPSILFPVSVWGMGRPKTGQKCPVFRTPRFQTKFFLAILDHFIYVHVHFFLFIKWSRLVEFVTFLVFLTCF